MAWTSTCCAVVSPVVVTQPDKPMPATSMAEEKNLFMRCLRQRGPGHERKARHPRPVELDRFEKDIARPHPDDTVLAPVNHHRGQVRLEHGLAHQLVHPALVMAV